MEDAIAFINAEPAVERRHSQGEAAWRVVSAEGESLARAYKDPGAAWRVRDAIQDDELKATKNGDTWRVQSPDKDLVFQGDDERLSRLASDDRQIAGLPATQAH